MEGETIVNNIEGWGIREDRDCIFWDDQNISKYSLVLGKSRLKHSWSKKSVKKEKIETFTRELNRALQKEWKRKNATILTL